MSRQVCVTGANGFIGRHLIPRLLSLGVPVVAYERPPLPGHPLVDVPGVEYVRGDIRDLDRLRSAISEGAIVVHLAAMTHAGTSLQVPEECFEINAMGTVRVLEACRLQRASGVLFISTALVYGAPRYEPVDEAHPTAPMSPYAASKLAAEAAIMAYASNYQLPACIARLSNVFGHGGHPEAVHTLILRQIAHGGPVELLDLSSIRDFIYVEDVVTAITLLLNQMDGDFRRVINVSSGRGVSIEVFAKALTRAVEDQTNKHVPVLQRGKAQLSSVRSIVLDNTEMATICGWQPAHDLHAGAAATVEAWLASGSVTRTVMKGVTL